MAPPTAPDGREFQHPASGHARKKKASPYGVQLATAFYIFLGASMVAAWFAPIQDCDETFNYWEPLHYISHGYGLQTWEYSPDYAIRSWLYIALHAVVGNFRRLLPQSSKVAEFFFVRYALALLCALCQTIFFKVTCLTLNNRVGMLFLIGTVMTPGNFHASAAFLPSSFAMYMCMLGAASFMNWRGGLKTAQGIFWFAMAGVLGWPFAAALCAPYLLEELGFAFFNDKDALLSSIVFVTPFYMWLAIFTLQPHKEERFMYPAYPFLMLNAAMSAHILLTAVGSADPKTIMGKVPAQLKFMAVGATLLLSLDIGLGRIYGIYSGYSAPLNIYSPLWESGASHPPLGAPGDLVCLGKEWHRFPSSYFLPRDMHAKFIRSEFRGLLPGEFSEAKTGFGFWSGTWLPAKGMNDRNEEDEGKYTELRACSFLVDTRYPEKAEALPPNEPDYIADTTNWDVVVCKPFLDAANTHLLARALWVPDMAFVPAKFKRRWGEHCLLQSKK